MYSTCIKFNKQVELRRNIVSKSLCQEWAGYGIRINSVAPGTVISSGMQNYPDAVQETVSTKFHAMVCHTKKYTAFQMEY
jgi:NAD(P)-dependent dehydrogenase (short-subunit alcohol dehydrogenase family)